jgi:hypothetical protein
MKNSQEESKEKQSPHPLPILVVVCIFLLVIVVGLILVYYFKRDTGSSNLIPIVDPFGIIDNEKTSIFIKILYGLLVAAIGIVVVYGVITLLLHVWQRREDFQSDPIFNEIRVEGDGNCLYRSLAYHKYDDEDRYEDVKNDLKKYLEKIENKEEQHGDYLRGALEVGSDEYNSRLTQIKKDLNTDKNWAGVETIGFASDCYGVPIKMLAKKYQLDFGANNDGKQWYLVFRNQNHFNAAEKKEDILMVGGKNQI